MGSKVLRETKSVLMNLIIHNSFTCDTALEMGIAMRGLGWGIYSFSQAISQGRKDVLGLVAHYILYLYHRRGFDLQCLALMVSSAVIGNEPCAT